ncbi:hypothetical protein O6P43_005544 [Quillaja saponaria]|uniref:Uncharacterized protein n=1 Tax=Quillaja saponaria TaxID=32244 RepID=A0AAD7VH78_QUISA|nr:hypothetical protein O6P43_005544 [Quillaja saponaria]
MWLWNVELCTSSCYRTFSKLQLCTIPVKELELGKQLWSNMLSLSGTGYFGGVGCSIDLASKGMKWTRKLNLMNSGIHTIASSTDACLKPISSKRANEQCHKYTSI